MASTTTKKRNSQSKTKNGVAPQNGKTPSSWDVIFANSGVASPADYARWTEHLANRKTPLSPCELFPHSSTFPLLWGLPERIHASSDLLDLVRGASQLEGRAGFPSETVMLDWLDPWLAEVDVRTNGYVLDCLVWTYALPKLAGRMPAQAWRDITLHLQGTVAEAQVAGGEIDPWMHALATGELPLTLAYQFPELPECRGLAKRAAKSVSRGLKKCLDGQGLIHCDRLDVMRPLLATWTRSIRLSQEMDGIKISKSAAAEYDWFVQHVMRLTRCDLTSVMSPRGEIADRESFADLMKGALAITGDKCDAAIFKSVLHAHAPKSNKEPRDHQLPAEPSYQSDWSELAVLQTGWSPKTPRLTVAHSRKNLRAEFSLGDEIVFAGHVEPEIKINGQMTRVTDNWECVCWFSDDEVDLLELRTNLTGNWRLERQLLMARDDQFLMMADVIVGDTDAEIDYRYTPPLGDGIVFDPADETNEGTLKGRRRLGLVLPLALPEWSVDPRFGSLTTDATGLQLQQTAVGRALYAPLFVDFHRRRMRNAATWRQLTLAENLEIVPRDQAVGYRVQVGQEQWLLYRSLVPTTSRSLLGQHLACEFLCGRFLHDGTVEPLVEIAGDDPESDRK